MHQFLFRFSFFTLVISSLAACGGGKIEAVKEEGLKLTGLPVVDQLSKQIQEQPNNPQLYMLRAKALADNDLMAEAVKDAEKLLELDSSKAVHYQLLADTYFDNNQSKPAIRTLERATARFPQEAQLWHDLAEIQLYVQDYDNATISADQYLKLKPNYAEGLFLKGQILKYSGDTMRAIDHFQMAVEQNSNHLESYIQLADLMELLDRPIALQYLDNALRIDSTNYDALFQKAQYFHNRNKFPEAIAAYERLIIAHPMQADPNYNLGLLYMEMKEYEKARSCFDKATKFNVQFERAYYFRGEAAEKLGDKAAAQKDYQQALRIQPNLQLALDGLKRLEGK